MSEETYKGFVKRRVFGYIPKRPQIKCGNPGPSTGIPSANPEVPVSDTYADGLPEKDEPV